MYVLSTSPGSNLSPNIKVHWSRGLLKTVHGGNHSTGNTRGLLYIVMMKALQWTHIVFSRQNLVIFSFHLRGAWRDRDTNDIFAHCSLIFYFLDFKFSNFVCPSKLHPLIWFFFKNSFRKKKNIRKTTQNALAPSIFIVLSIALKLGTPLLHTQAQNTLLQNF